MVGPWCILKIIFSLKLDSPKNGHSSSEQRESCCFFSGDSRDNNIVKLWRNSPIGCCVHLVTVDKSIKLNKLESEKRNVELPTWDTTVISTYTPKLDLAWSGGRSES